MTTWLRQSTAADVELGAFVDDTDGKTPETSLSIVQADCQLIKNGGTAAQKNSSTAASHLGGGHYKIPLDATDTGTLGRLRVFVNKSGAMPAWRDFEVVTANKFDSAFSTDRLQVHVVEMEDGVITDDVLADGALTLSKVASDLITELTDYSSVADSILDEAMAGHTTAGTVGAALQDAADGDYIAGDSSAALNARRGYQGLVRGTAVTGVLSTTAFSTSLTETTNDHYNNRIVTFTSGPLAGQSSQILDYNGSTKVLSVAAMTEAPANGNEFIIT